MEREKSAAKEKQQHGKRGNAERRNPVQPKAGSVEPEN
jgi:hypothetical protein